MTSSLHPDVAAFVQSGVSITIASSDERLIPSIAKGVGCRLAGPHDRVTVFAFASEATALARDVARFGRVAVAFSQPSTHRTVQIKGSDARVVACGPPERALARRCLALFADDLRPLGWGAEFVDAALWQESAELLAVEFTPEVAFQQTPGPTAGRPLDAAAAADEGVGGAGR